MAKYFSPSKSVKMRSEITSFSQHNGESLYDAWERFKDLLQRCPHHAILKWIQVQTFYNGLNHPTRAMIDTSTRGSLNTKTPKEAIELFEIMAANNYSATHDRGPSRSGVLELDKCNFGLKSRAITKVATITKQLGQVQVGAIFTPALVCDFCGGGMLMERMRHQFLLSKLATWGMLKGHTIIHTPILTIQGGGITQTFHGTTLKELIHPHPSANTSNHRGSINKISSAK